jgi:DNA repair exonuclease SbcCD ATPase subunit
LLLPRFPFRVRMKLPIRSLLHLGCFLLLATVITAQNRAPIPTLTSDDVTGTKPSVLPPSSNPKDAGKDSPEKSPTKDATSSTPVKSAEDPKKKAEKEWNERLKKAQEKQDELKRRADQIELQITQQRNQLFSAAARSPEMNGQINTRINELSALQKHLRAQAQTAQQEVAIIQSEGRLKSYQVMEAPLTDEQGAPDAKAYQAEQEKLQTELRDAKARVEVLQIRLNAVQGEVLKKGNGDNFTLNRLRQERDRITTELAETRARIEDLNSKLQNLRQKASASGIAFGAR